MNKLDETANSLASFYGADPRTVRDTLRKGIHDGLTLKAAEMIFLSVMQKETGKAPHRMYSTADMAEITGLSHDEINLEIEEMAVRNPDQVTGYTMPSNLTPKPKQDFQPNPDSPGEYLVTARGIMLMVLTSVKEGSATPKEKTMAENLFLAIARNGYGMPAKWLQKEIMSRPADAIKSWTKAVYDVYIDQHEVMAILKSL
ncbi:MAG: hypothetical protein EOM08_07275 [Clostridia bacterium]|nr:hypothetical protein [Clostridia bacterium]